MKNKKRSRNNAQGKVSEDVLHGPQTPCCALVHHLVQNDETSVLSRLCQAWPCPPMTQTRTLRDFLTYLNTQSPDVVSGASQSDIRIQMDAIQNELERIKCIRCKSSAESSLQGTGLANSVLDLPQGDGSPTTFNLSAEMVKMPPSKRYDMAKACGNDDDDDQENDSGFEQAQCYQRMEEGTQTPDEKPKIISLRSFVRNEKTVSLILSQPVDEELIDILVRHILVPCGFENGTRELTSEQMDAIKEKVKNQCEHYTSQLQKVRRDLDDLEERLGSYHLNPLAGFKVKVSKLLEGCDSLCDKLLDGLIAILLQITSEYHGLPSLQSMQPYIEGLWNSYYKTVQAMLDSSIIHENKLRQIATRPGVVPLMAVDAGHRSSFHGMMKKRHKALNDFHRDLYRFVTDGGSVLQRRLTGQNAFFALVQKSSREPAKLDATCEKLVRTHEHLVSNVLPCYNVSEIPKKYKVHAHTVIQVMEEVNAAITREYSQVDCMNSEQIIQLKQEYTKISQHHRQVSSKRDDDEEDDSEMLADHMVQTRQTLTDLTVNLLTQWRCIRSLMIEGREFTPLIPFPLDRWIEFGDQWLDCLDCQNSGGRRIAAILGSLIFQAISQRCEEWHAELMQLELLQEIEPMLGEAAPKTKKKRRKKKKRKAVASVAAVQSEPAGSDMEQEESAPSEPPSTQNQSKVPDSSQITISPTALEDSFDNGEWEVVGSKKISSPNGKKSKKATEERPSKMDTEGKQPERGGETTSTLSAKTHVPKPTERKLGIQTSHEENPSEEELERRLSKQDEGSKDREVSALVYSESNPQDVSSAREVVAGHESTGASSSGAVASTNDQTNKAERAAQNAQTMDTGLMTDVEDANNRPRHSPGENAMNGKKKKKKKKSQRKGGSGDKTKAPGSPNNDKPNIKEAQIEKESDSSSVDEYISVGVIGMDGEFQSAEDFLVGRLEVILDLKRKPDNGPPIIHL